MNTSQKRIATILTVIIMAGCSKGNSITTPAPDPDNTVTILQSGAWKIAGFTISPALNGVTDVLLNMPPCVKDNLFQFKANGIFNLDEGATRYNPAGPQVETGTWTYDASIRQLKFSSATVDFIVNIQSISNTSMSGTRPVVVNGANYTYSGTFEKQ